MNIFENEGLSIFGQATIVKVTTVTVSKAFGSDLLDDDNVVDSAVIWEQPAGSVLLGIKMVLDVPFVAEDLTTAIITLGDALKPDGMLVAGAMNLKTDAAGTIYKTRGDYWDSSVEGVFWYAHAAKEWTGYATLEGANCSALTAGQVTFYFTYERVV